MRGERLNRPTLYGEGSSVMNSVKPVPRVIRHDRSLFFQMIEKQLISRPQSHSTFRNPDRSGMLHNPDRSNHEVFFSYFLVFDEVLCLSLVTDHPHVDDIGSIGQIGAKKMVYSILEAATL